MAAQETEQPWVFSTRELIRRPGTMREFSRRVTVPERIGTDIMAVQPEGILELHLRMESVVEGVLATGSVRATATGMCVRCLDEVELDLDVAFQELFAYPERASHHRGVVGRTQRQHAGEENQTDTEEEQYELDDDLMDLEEIVRDAIVTALPFQPVCRDDCPGLCSQCGARLADDPDHQHDLIDPRWSALASLATPSTDDEKRN